MFVQNVEYQDWQAKPRTVQGGSFFLFPHVVEVVSCILCGMQQHEHWRRLLLRTEETARRYEEAARQPSGATGCRLCADPESLAEYTYWRRMPNLFPYDRFFAKSDMLVIKRHTDERGLTQEEREELLALKSGVLGDMYDSLLDHLPRQKSIPHHCHFHLIEFRRPE